MTKYLWKKYEIKKAYEKEDYIATKAGDGYFNYKYKVYTTPFHESGYDKPNSVTVEDSYDLMQYFEIVNQSYISDGLLKHKKSDEEYRFDDYAILGKWVVLSKDDTCAFYIDRIENDNDSWCSEIKYLETRTITKNTKGLYIGDVISENRKQYPNNSYSSGFWYVYQGIANNPPEISETDTNLGEKNQPFEIQYSVEDKDITDNVTVTEYLNNRQIRRITNANNTEQTLKITSELLNSCPLGEINTIKIYAEDEKGAGTYRNYWFKRTNTPPYFAEENTDLGTISKAPTITFTAKDDDGDKYLKAKVKINQRVVKVYDQLGNGEQVSFTLDWKDFMQLNHSRKHNLWVEIEDSSGALATLKYTFEREVNSIEIVTNTAPLDIKIKLIVFNANIKLGEGATFLQYACNDFGTGNTWEEIQNGVPYEFKNEHAGNDKIGYKCKLTKGTTESEIKSIGG